MGEVTQLLQAEEPGSAAGERLIPLVYDELRRIAAAKLARESAALTLQPTALVHEAWLRLGGDDAQPWRDRRHFLGAAAEAMRRILIDRARRRLARRHGSGQVRANSDALDDIAGPLPDERLLQLNDALERYRSVDPTKHELVRLRYFAGLSLEESAAALDISLATAKRWWTYARAWLLREMTCDDSGPPAQV